MDDGRFPEIGAVTTALDSWIYRQSNLGVFATLVLFVGCESDVRYGGMVVTEKKNSLFSTPLGDIRAKWSFGHQGEFLEAQWPPVLCISSQNIWPMNGHSG